MPIVPDDKNWTWVLERPCPECGFVAEDHDVHDTARTVRDNAESWPALLAHPQAAIRPTDSQWSALEYGCHVRDVFRIYTYRLGLILTEDDPLFPNWDQDETAVTGRYGEQEPATVAGELVAAGEALAAAFEVQPRHVARLLVDRDHDVGVFGGQRRRQRGELLRVFYVAGEEHHAAQAVRQAPPDPIRRRCSLECGLQQRIRQAHQAGVASMISNDPRRRRR